MTGLLVVAGIFVYLVIAGFVARKERVKIHFQTEPYKHMETRAGDFVLMFVISMIWVVWLPVNFLADKIVWFIEGDLRKLTSEVEGLKSELEAARKLYHQAANGNDDQLRIISWSAMRSLEAQIVEKTP